MGVSQHLNSVFSISLALTCDQAFLFSGERESMATVRVGGSFLLLRSLNRRFSRCHTFALPRKKERLIAGYFGLSVVIGINNSGETSRGRASCW